MNDPSRIFDIMQASIIIIFFIIGTFGNVMLILITVKNTDFHNKSGILLATTAFAHFICLISQTVDAYTLLDGGGISRITCFEIIFLYLNAIQFQAVMALIMVIDLLFAIVLPVWYKSVNTKRYVILCILPALIYALSFQWSSIATLVDDQIDTCNTMNVIYSATVRTARYTGNVIVNTLTVIAYIVSIVMFRKKCKTNGIVRAMMRRVGVTAICYICSWYMASFSATIINLFFSASYFKAALQAGSVVFGLICCSQNFYICIWRSQKYRQAFYKLFVSRKPRKTESTARRSQVTVTRLVGTY